MDNRPQSWGGIPMIPSCVPGCGSRPQIGGIGYESLSEAVPDTHQTYQTGLNRSTSIGELIVNE